ncbi:hypothetical protein C8F04DRAFT_1252801 [Mycena alexandri]|uniref:Uncharacterized protein n=1 Tax=Mycena alexandri TaxID=1745969 RepID=A0AAD6X735_9AGAR|nr:hypothetical protein C8F04DRAFT_1252801 [Mycena alexandri]
MRVRPCPLHLLPLAPPARTHPLSSPSYRSTKPTIIPTSHTVTATSPLSLPLHLVATDVNFALRTVTHPALLVLGDVLACAAAGEERYAGGAGIAPADDAFAARGGCAHGLDGATTMVSSFRECAWVAMTGTEKSEPEEEEMPGIEC